MKGANMPNLKTVRAIMEPWKNAQRPMDAVIRWGNFPRYGQKLVWHNNSVPIVLTWVERVVKQHRSGLEIDWALLYRSFVVHDHGEPLTGGDEHADARTAGKEVWELQAYSKLVNLINPKWLNQHFILPFILQFVRKGCAGNVPLDHSWALNKLKQENQNEAIIFEFIERMDYIFTALHGYYLGIRNGKEGMLEHCFRNQAPKLDGLCEELPVLAQIWTPTLRDELTNLAADDARRWLDWQFRLRMDVRHWFGLRSKLRMFLYAIAHKL